MPGVTATMPPTVAGATARFAYADPDHALAGVRLWQELQLDGALLDFARTPNGWSLELDLPDVLRMEYLLALTHRAGRRALVIDPANPRTVEGAFGAHSVLELPGYRPPEWLSAPRADGIWTELVVPSQALRAELGLRVWSPADVAADRPLPMLVAHDGPEYDHLADLTGYSAAMIAAGTLPPHRVALLAPGSRDEWYSASPTYATALCLAVLPALRAAVGVAGLPVGMGASLGGLAMLHAQRRRPHTFHGLFCQSGSFFHPRFDAHESRFSRYGRVSRYVQTVLRASGARDPIPVAMTCGALEENLANNQLMARGLAAQGYDVDLTEVADVHSYTAWRDAFDPALTDLLARLWA